MWFPQKPAARPRCRSLAAPNQLQRALSVPRTSREGPSKHTVSVSVNEYMKLSN